jgi:catechol 2,3-dioxygenase-like lactoylglutathione lyase family enzyme
MRRSPIPSFLLVLVSVGANHLLAQISRPNSAGVAMGHLHYRVRDLEANRKFWIALGGKPVRIGSLDGLKFPDVFVVLERGEPDGPTDGSVVNHVAFRVQSLKKIEAAGMKVQYNEQYVGVAYVFSPEGEKVELFDETATNLTFTADDGRDDPVARRHNRKIAVPIMAHHIHLYLPEAAVPEAKAWYSKIFGGLAGKRWRYEATDLPGINFNFSAAPQLLPTNKGRMLDHIGLEVRNLQAFCTKLEAAGVKFDVPYQRQAGGIASAFFTDPWGTYIELTEGLSGL